MKTKYLLIFIFAAVHVNMFSGDIISVKTGMFGIDEGKKLVVVNQSIDEINAEWLQKKDAIRLMICIK